MQQFPPHLEPDPKSVNENLLPTDFNGLWVLHLENVTANSAPLLISNVLCIFMPMLSLTLCL